MGFFMDWSATP